MQRKRKPTIKDIAQAAGVTPMTVSRILNNKQQGASEATRERILRLASEMGYVANPLARGLRGGGPSNTLGVVIADITRPFSGELLYRLSLAADQFNYGLMLYAQGDKAHSERVQHYASLLVSGINDGVILDAMVDYKSFLPYLKQAHIPYVLLDHVEDVAEPTVITTNRRGMTDATRHVLALGHKCIGFIAGPQNHSAADERLKGFTDALDEIDLSIDPDRIQVGDFSQVSGFQMGRKLLSMQPMPTAIIASNDGMAFGVMESIRERGLEISRDVSVVGFDDLPMAAKVSPPLTTVRQPVDQVALEALELLISLIEGRPTPRMKRELSTELIVRESTGHPRSP